jgi:tetratricopeptide (TPR) repeat protein
VKISRAILVLLLLITVAFALGTSLQSRALGWVKHAHDESALKLLLGDSRRLFANHFYTQADVSFHSGYYPSIFDQARNDEEKENAMGEAQRGSTHDQHDEYNSGREQQAGGFLGQPTDWIDRFGRHFRVTEHTHVEGGNVREILPWLKMSAELDPQKIETYTVAAYWLRTKLNKIDEAEQFLRQGLKANPNSYEILVELGQLYQENRHDPQRARGVFQLAFRRWQQTESNLKEPNYVAYNQITEILAALEREAGNNERAIEWFELAKAHAPDSKAVQTQIDELRAKIGTK